MLLDSFVNHRTTSPNHPQADMLTERCVQTLKTALRKCCVKKGASSPSWDKEVPWIAMGYRCSPQQSTRMSPHYMLFGARQLIPSKAT